MRKYIVKMNELFIYMCIMCLYMCVIVCVCVYIYIRTHTWKPEVDDGYRSTTL